MDSVPRVQEQDPDEDAGGHAAAEFSALLPKMQAGDADLRVAISYDRYPSARRIDAEPIIREAVPGDRLFCFVRRDFTKEHET